MVSQFPNDWGMALVPAQKFAVCACLPRIFSMEAVKRRCRIIHVVLECSINQDTFIIDAIETAKRVFVVPIASATGIILVVGNVTTIQGPITRSPPSICDDLNATSDDKGKKVCLRGTQQDDTEQEPSPHQDGQPHPENRQLKTVSPSPRPAILLRRSGTPRSRSNSFAKPSGLTVPSVGLQRR